MLDFDIDKMCRVCLQTNIELFLLFDEQNAIDGVFLSNIISEMTIFTIRRHDDFPHQICLECMHRVRRAYEVKKQFEQSHRKLLKYLESINKITIDTTPDIKNDKCIQTEDSTLFPCEKCDDKFVSYQSLREHRQASHKGTANICRFCCKTFNRIGDLKNHIAVHHPEIKHFNPHECLICNRRFTRKDHVNRHMAKIHKIESGQMSEDEDLIINEMKSDDNELEILTETEIDYGNLNLTKIEDTCEILSNKDSKDYDDRSIDAAENPFSSDEDDKPLAGLRGAINVKNKDSENISIKLEIDDSPTVDLFCVPKTEELETDNKDNSLAVGYPQELKRKFKCSICDKSFMRRNHLKRHYLSHKEEKPFPCVICDKRFSRADHLKSHMSKHDNKRSFKCEICERSYNRADILKRHKEKKHNAYVQSDISKSEYCDVCNKTFSTKAYLQKHMRMHTNKSWKCKLCPEGFETKEALKEHNKSHGKEKPFLCSECGLRFVRNDYLLIHMRRHTGEKPYKCKYCEKGFPRATDLNVHVKYHTGERTHLCTICGKGFQRSYNLVVHMRVHTGERPYQCSHCPKNFAQCNDLKAHIRRHTGERYKCEICGIGFVQGYLLTQHKIAVHGVEGEARKGRVSKVEPTKSIIKDVPEAVDDPPNDIKKERETCNTSPSFPLIENKSPDEIKVLAVELNLSDL